MYDEIVYLSRRNLLALLAKLDANVEAGCAVSQCAIIKHQPVSIGAPYRQTMDSLVVIAVEDEAFYAGQGRAAGQMIDREEVNLPKPSTGVETGEGLFSESAGLSAEVEVD